MKELKSLSLIVILFLIITLVGCMPTTKYLLTTECSSDTKTLFSRLGNVFKAQQFKIVDNDPASGFLKAVYVSKSDNAVMKSFLSVSSGYQNEITWIIKVVDNKIEATVNYQRFEYIGDTKSLKKDVWGSDNLSKDVDWYWSIRNELVKVCGNNIKIIEIEKEQK